MPRRNYAIVVSHVKFSLALGTQSDDRNPKPHVRAIARASGEHCDPFLESVVARVAC